MAALRKPFQGVLNIIRFNWHFYAITVALALLLLGIAGMSGKPIRSSAYLLSLLLVGPALLSLLASYYIYDLSGLYGLAWIRQTDSERLIVNIHAGFDETSALLEQKFRPAELIALDFYDPVKHTEVSIKRARKVCLPYPRTRQVETEELPLGNNSADKIFVIFSAHEIRDAAERVLFFKELARIIKPDGEIYITEHLRDAANFMVYNIGFFHFYTKRTWLNTFKQASLATRQELKCTPFISTFILHKNGNTP